MCVIVLGFLLRQKDLGTTLVLLPILSEKDRVLSPNAEYISACCQGCAGTVAHVFKVDRDRHSIEILCALAAEGEVSVLAVVLGFRIW